jgi:hypothetical protein
MLLSFFVKSNHAALATFGSASTEAKGEADLSLLQIHDSRRKAPNTR